MLIETEVDDNTFEEHLHTILTRLTNGDTDREAAEEEILEVHEQHTDKAAEHIKNSLINQISQSKYR